MRLRALWIMRVNDGSRKVLKSFHRTVLLLLSRTDFLRSGDADEIIVITEDGIAERGTHEELLDMNGVYAAYYNM